MANRHFVKELSIKVEFSELSQKAFTRMIHFLEMFINGKFNLIKRLKRPNTKIFKILGLSRTFLCKIYLGDHRTLKCRLTSRSWLKGAE